MLDLLFETSWEVCNKVGGIYTVLSTKAKTLQRRHKDQVIFIGPDLSATGAPSTTFIKGDSRHPLWQWQRHAVLPTGMTVKVGRWNIAGKPLAVLVGFGSLYPYKNELYAEMWNKFGVDSLHAYGDYDESCMFAHGAALVIESIVLWRDDPNLRVVAHFDEWQTGMGLLSIKMRMPSVATVFTTHATSIGRSICGNGKPLYDYMAGYHGDQMAGELNMQSKHSLEKAAAHAADAFTTVSEVTARECDQLLECHPLVTPNGFELSYVPRGEKLIKARAAARQRMLQVAEALTGVHYGDDTMLVATSGRCEVRNKGIDVYLDAINALRTSLGRVTSLQRQVVAWVFVPAWVKAPRTDLAQNLAGQATTRLFNPVITHQLHDSEGDAIYSRINALGMHNEASDTVHVIDVPCYLNGDDGIFNMSYYDLLPGLDAAVFASYYEPWGYTPHESAAFGVPTITTDLAGFGQWVLDHAGHDPQTCGVRVLHRTDSNYAETVSSLESSLIDLYVMPDGDARRVSKAARATSRKATWEEFIDYYEAAYEQALRLAQHRKQRQEEYK